jgi:hypothetical protein
MLTLVSLALPGGGGSGTHQDGALGGAGVGGHFRGWLEYQW